VTPAERQRLAEALTAATGESWRVAGRIEDPAVEGVCREVGRPVGILRAGSHGYLVTESRLHLYFGPTPDKRGIYKGRGWVDRFVVDAVAAVRRYDATPRPVALSTRDRRRAETYRRILHPDSGAAESERVQARRHLARLGIAP
jgi:hypothetical protein